ncbi:MAG: hypothetical protein JW716_02700 [Candidatus Aenigmarchaeota archaeon]|nr:hypothetical protein [Candidatus Aenigmarchaeota archaeon]
MTNNDFFKTDPLGIRPVRPDIDKQIYNPPLKPVNLDRPPEFEWRYVPDHKVWEPVPVIRRNY